MSKSATEAEMNQVAPIEKPELPVVQSNPDALLAKIMQAADSPSFNVEAFERLLAMHERMKASAAKAAFAEAMAVMQPKLPVITQRGKIVIGNKVQSKFAFWEDIIEAIRPILTEHGFALTFRLGQSDKSVTVTAVIAHKDGHSEETTITLPADNSGNKNPVQAVGSTTSYGKRYTTCALLNITTKGEDDDGVKGGAGDTISAEQKDQIIARMKALSVDTAAFLKHLRVAALDDMLASDFPRAMKALDLKESQKKGKGQ